MSADVTDKQNDEFKANPLKNSIMNASVCVLVGHSIEAITSAVVLASLGQRIHLYADSAL